MSSAGRGAQPPLLLLDRSPWLRTYRRL